jgi:CRISPR-associated endonuclease/helicase Cas3
VKGQTKKEATINQSPQVPPTGHWAHTDPTGGLAWHPLAEHLEAVAARARSACEAFDAGDWGHLAGHWHDLGKYSESFQEYLRQAGSPDTHEADALPRTDHSTAGAQHADERFGRFGHLLAYVISGHHSGLLDALGANACLDARLKKPVEPWNAAPPEITDQAQPAPPGYLQIALARKDPVAIAFFVKMLFSALVDADFLDTEAFMDPARASARPSWPADVIERMAEALESRIAEFGTPGNEVDRRRAEVTDACRAAAVKEPGLFSLTVPTGGGKTLSSLLFALEHAKCHGLRQVIYVAPFTSIIEQNADEYRRVFAPLVAEGLADPVLEHHSNVEVDPGDESVQSRLATENWDAPLVVTTAVQFYESLYANRTSRCRKLHRLARSVVILDEAQAIPVEYLDPCLRAIEALTKCFGATIVLCTATQPAVHRREGFDIGLEVSPEREIIPEPKKMFHALRRVHVEVAGRLPDEEVAERLREHEQALCIVNTRRHARALAEELGQEPGHYHLSALMCPQHRSEILAEVKVRLRDGARCRVVSTQLIEAGVDVDFPAVFRALSGLDSIAQAAGRCNRNGGLPHGVTTVFEPEKPGAPGFVRAAATSARPLLEMYDDLLGPEAIEHYFRLHYWEQKRGANWKRAWDREGILDRFRLDGGGRLPFLFDFASAARDFVLIEERGQTVFIPYGERGMVLCQALGQAWPSPGMQLLRSLQRFTVQVPEHTWREHREGPFEVVHELYPVLAFPEEYYSPWLGLDLEGDPAELLVR